jgi:hypothetical protein
MSAVGEEAKRPLSIEEHQEALLFQFVNLYERWSEDRQVAAKQGHDLSKQITQFVEAVSRFSSIEEAVIAKLKKSLHETVVNLAEQANSATRNAVESALGNSIKCMSDAATTVDAILASNQQIKWLSHVKTLAVNILCSLVVSSAIVWLFMPQPSLPLTQEDMNTYMIGKKFVHLWPTLSKEKQQWILSNVKEKEHKTIR